MTSIFKKISPEWPLRLGLGLMYLYSGSSIFYYPSHWYGFIPQWFYKFILGVASLDLYLRVQGVGEFIIGLLFLAWFSGVWGLRIASTLAVIEMATILLFVGVDLITFRDIGLLGASISILIFSFGSKKIEEVKTVSSDSSKIS